MRWFVAPVAMIGFALGASLPALAAPAPAPAAPPSQPLADLTWFIVGLRDLGKSRDARLRLLPAQAKKILPILEKLAQDKILVVEIPERQGPAGGRFYVDRRGGGLAEKQRPGMRERLQKMAQRIQQDIDKMNGVLRQAQSDYIMSLDFDPAVYGLERIRIQVQDQRSSQAERQKMLKERQEARERLVRLNREVLAMVRKLAAGK